MILLLNGVQLEEVREEDALKGPEHEIVVVDD